MCVNKIVVVDARPKGDFTVLAAEPFCLVGVDVAAPSQLRRPGRVGGIQAAIQLMRNQFSPAEVSGSGCKFNLLYPDSSSQCC